MTEATERWMRRGTEEGWMQGERGKGTGSKCQAESWRITQGLVIMPRWAQRQAAVVWMSDHTYLPPVCPSTALDFSLSLSLTLRTHTHTLNNTMRGKCNIWPTSWNKLATYQRQQESDYLQWEVSYRNYCYRMCRESVQICHSKTWSQPTCPLNCKIFINNYELIEENIWSVRVTVILARKCDEFLVFIRISLTLM